MKRSKSDTIAVEIKNLSKKYEIHHEKPTLVEKFIKGPNETFWALRDINLTIKKGEKVGILGPNGSGKTTFLKIIAGITTPSSGSVSTDGKIVSLIDLAAGFHEDLTGYQNIYLNGMLLGLTKQYIDALLSAIIRFADIRQFIDAPLYTYSDGMKLRLGFSIALHARPDILILDEGFAAGDISFQTKTEKQMLKLLKSNATILVATHWIDYVKRHCQRVIVFSHGKIAHNDNVKSSVSYERMLKTHT